MSLRDSGYKPAPGFEAYTYRESIPENERCTSCDGMGTRRTRNSMTGIDWETCRTCSGSGRKSGETPWHPLDTE